jgi:2-oxoisovalerate dehydrogenase E1 component
MTSNSESLQLLRQMMLIRQLEQKALDLSAATPPEVVGSIHLCAGQEAVPVGTLAALNSQDQVVATYRGHGWALASGLSVSEVLGEICHRTIGINGGRAGSAYMMAPGRRFIGENSIVGAGIPIACGVALANQRLANGKVVVVSVGDGAFNQGATHEGLAFAAARRLPVLVICENNGWSEMTATADMFKVPRIAQRASGYGFPGVTIDGTDPFIVRDTIRGAAEKARGGHGPVLIECRVPRLWGHYNRDIEHYRSRQDKQDAAQRDPVASFADKLIRTGLATEENLRQLRAEVTDELEEIANTVLRAPKPDPDTACAHIYSPRMTAKVAGSTADADREPRTMTYLQAVNEGLRSELEARPDVVVYGEDVGKAGGIFGAAKGLQKSFGPERVFDTPIAESAILGSAVGAALVGVKPIVEIMWADFILVALDQLINQAANVRYITQGQASAPLVVRTQQGIAPGSCAQHSQSLEALLLHIPGLRVALPSNPQDAYSLLRAAVASDDPCVIIESRALYQHPGPVVLSDTPEAIGLARLHGRGGDAAIVCWGSMVPVALEASRQLAERGIQVAVLDLRWLSPLDEEALLDVVRSASGRVVVAHEANLTGGFGAEIATWLHERLGRELDLDVIRVGMPDTRVPAAPVLQQRIRPDSGWIRDAVVRLVK